MENKSYVFNLETTKIELHFTKEEYSAFSDEQKKVLKSNFLFSGKNKCWVSRAKEPNLYGAKKAAQILGFTQEQREGERCSFAEQLQKKVAHAEERAERLENYSEKAIKRAEVLQKPLNEKRGDIAFFTQPIIAGHAGSQSFARQREKIYNMYHKGFEEYRKSEYFKDKAATALSTASMEKLGDKGYLDRQIKKTQKEIRDREKNIARYEDILSELEQGVIKNRYDGTPITDAEVREWINRELELIEVAIDKEGFFTNCLEKLGGVLYNKENILKGDIVRIKTFGKVEVIGKGTKNITYKILTGGAAGMCGKCAYAEIL